MKVIELLSCLTFLPAITLGVEIQCNFINAFWSEDIGNLYTCFAIVINVENPTTVTDITGTHLAGKGNEDVKGFAIGSHQILTTIPKGIENFFANLEAFQWMYGSISTIDSSTFEPFKNLLSIRLAWNKLVTLDGDLFQHTRKLREIAVYGNLLLHVGNNLLTGLTNLTIAYFGNNPCINIWAETPQQIEELKIQLPIQCPPLATAPDPTIPTRTQPFTTIPSSTATSDPQTTTISTTNAPNECPICTCNEEADEMIVELKRQVDGLERALGECSRF